MSELGDMLKTQLQAQTQTIARAFKAGHESGYREGFEAGIAEAQKIINNVFPRNPTQEKSA